jgi:hypothetical protein
VGNLLLMISKNSSLKEASQSLHHILLLVNGQQYFTVMFTGSKRAQMNNSNKYRTEEDVF